MDASRSTATGAHGAPHCCSDLRSPNLPRLKLHPPTPEAPQKARDMMGCDMPDSPRTPPGAGIPQAAYTVCPNAPGPKHLLEEPCGYIPPQPWWGYK